MRVEAAAPRPHVRHAKSRGRLRCRRSGTRAFTAALREVVERGVRRNAVLNLRSVVCYETEAGINDSSVSGVEGWVLGTFGILRDMRELDKARAYAQRLIDDAPDPVFVA